MKNGPLEDVFPIEHADIPGSYVSSPEGNSFGYIHKIYIYIRTPGELLAVLPWCRFSGQYHRPADSLRHGLGKLHAFGHLHQVCCFFLGGNQTENVVVTCMFVVFLFVVFRQGSERNEEMKQNYYAH